MLASLYRASLPLVAALAVFPVVAGAASPAPVELAVRVNALFADVDLHGAGVAGRLPLRDGWFVDATLERQTYARARWDDVRPAGDLESTVLGAALGRRGNGERGPAWFWTWGIAVGFPETGASSGAGQPRHDAASTEVHLTASLGVSGSLSAHWSLDAALRVERHFVDWRLSDPDGRLLERRSTLTPVGAYLALSYRF